MRNEVLLLLAELSKGNADLQNILAFQVRRGRGPAGDEEEGAAGCEAPRLLALK